MLLRPHFSSNQRDILASRIIDPCATFPFYKFFCISKFLLIKCNPDRKILPNLLIKILRYKKNYMNPNKKLFCFSLVDNERPKKSSMMKNLYFLSYRQKSTKLKKKTYEQSNAKSHGWFYINPQFHLKITYFFSYLTSLVFLRVSSKNSQLFAKQKNHQDETKLTVLYWDPKSC